LVCLIPELEIRQRERDRGIGDLGKKKKKKQNSVTTRCRPHPSWARNGPSSFSLGLEARWACAHVVVPAAGVTKVRSCLFNNVAYTVLFSIDSRAGSEWFYSI
jgi:hypothetical protein